MKTSELKKLARQAGADLVGVAPASRWADWPAARNPATLQPRCRAVIVVGRRVLRGTLRGVEEGTCFGSTYNMFGAVWMEHHFLTRTLHQVATLVEETGHEAVPLTGGTTPGAAVQLDSKALAHAAGLGSVGKGGFFLTREYGHRQRFGLILTDLELEGDPVVDLDFCRDCDACLKACPLQAMTDRGEAMFGLDTRLCERCANGRLNMAPGSYESLDRLAASCGRACLVALEGKIGSRYAAPFRRRSVWTRDIDGVCTVHPLEHEEGVSR
jgi:epoxyqueuosine reductase QueG